MKVALIGATGFVGSHLLEELVVRGFEVTALARSVEKISLKGDNLRSIAVDVTDSEALSSVIKGSDIVLSAFNASWSNPNIYDDFMKGAQAIQAAVKKAGIKRYIVIGGAGSLFIDGKQIVDSPDFPEQIKGGATAARDYLNLLKKETELDWTLVSPALDMFPGERTGKYRLNTESPVFDNEGDSKISVQDFAVAVVDELKNHKYSRLRFTVGY
ncbi:NAD(P)H-binding protein [Dysgonomonas sp. Marseille-P4677]|uniref:NAD(P)-dependent oxidoreductase n=1 Tax=Dysgonomonas sp. Marseille-P4677 TaxID=2364790 RepID=UPI0019127B1C|nr:NAD(P)H-binding protein [Dysgonomonas sp. Marseille-P4677]MBK5722075.1 NAD(P)H-binding protein [Dysgonomonas sp. Marseille-P4677]